MENPREKLKATYHFFSWLYSLSATLGKCSYDAFPYELWVSILFGWLALRKFVPEKNPKVNNEAVNSIRMILFHLWSRVSLRNFPSDLTAITYSKARKIAFTSILPFPWTCPLGLIDTKRTTMIAWLQMYFSCFDLYFQFFFFSRCPPVWHEPCIILYTIQVFCVKSHSYISELFILLHSWHKRNKAGSGSESAKYS